MKRHIPSIILGLVGGAFLCAAGVAIASRNAAGTYSLATGPYVTGTTISATAVNSEFSDIATELTSSLDRSGRGGMLSNLRGIDGTVAAPAFSWTSESGSGLFRNGAGDVRMAVTGALVEQYQTTGVTVPGNVTLSGASSVLALTGATAAKVGIGMTPGNTFDITVPGSANASVSNWFEPSLADGNLLNLWMGKSTAAGGAGKITYTKNATAANSTYCLGVVGGSDSTLCVDGNAKTILGGGTATSTMRHQRFGSLCTTAVGVGAGCSSTVTWTIAFVDANYTVSCTGDGISAGAPMSLIVTAKSATQITVLTTNNSGINGGQFTSADCVAFHD